MHTPVRSFLMLGLMLAACRAGAGEVIGNTYIGERFGYIELTSVDGKWEVSDKENTAKSDFAGPIAHFKLKEPVSGWRPDVNILGFKKIEGAVTLDFVAATMRNQWIAQGGEVDPIEIGRLSGRKILMNEKRLTAQGIPMRARDIFLEGEKGIFIISVIVPANAYPQVLPLLEELAAGAKY